MSQSSYPARRTGRVERATKESSVLVEIDLDGTGEVDVETGIGFYDPCSPNSASTVCSTCWSRASATCTWTPTTRWRTPPWRWARPSAGIGGDRVGILLLQQKVPPLDEVLAEVTVADLSGRPYLVHSEPAGMASMIGAYDTTLTRHIFESFVAQAQICACTCTCHLRAQRAPHRRGPVQGRGPGPARRHRTRPAGHRRAQYERRAVTSSYSSAFLILLGLFLAGGVISFAEAGAWPRA